MTFAAQENVPTYRTRPKRFGQADVAASGPQMVRRLSETTAHRQRPLPLKHEKAPSLLR